jgi:hypothetical protein
MKSRTTYSQSEANEIIALIKEKLKSDSAIQKGIRAKIRRKGFWASEFGFRDGYTIEDFLSVVTILGVRDTNIANQLNVTPKVVVAQNPNIKLRQKSDESYVIDICDEILQLKASRQHHFDFLRGDTGIKLPVDAYYESLNLVIEYREKQHTEEVKFFDHKMTSSGVTRDVQRRLYDERRREKLPENGIKLIEIDYLYLEHSGSKKLIRNKEADLEIIKEILNIN